MFSDGRREERATSADAEVRRYVAASPFRVLKFLDVELFQRPYQPPEIGLVFERYDTDVKQFLKRRPLKVAGMRHVLRSVLAALAYMHQLGLVHADLKPANMLLRGAGVFKDGWRSLFQRAESASGAASASGSASACGGANIAEPLEITFQLPTSFEVRSS